MIKLIDNVEEMVCCMCHKEIPIHVRTFYKTETMEAICIFCLVEISEATMESEP